MQIIQKLTIQNLNAHNLYEGEIVFNTDDNKYYAFINGKLKPIEKGKNTLENILFNEKVRNTQEYLNSHN